MKTVKFRDYLVPLVISGKKTSTWRLFDDKDLSVGDKIELRGFGKEVPFGTAIITRVVEKSFQDLEPADFDGHNAYRDEAEMYRTFSGYYNRPVGPDTVVKIIWFKLD
jgi:hypothetical protein